MAGLLVTRGEGLRGGLADAAAIEAKDNDWIECVNANGVFVCRAVVSHRMPEGVVYVHHAQDLGPTGNQRDIVTTIRRRSQEVRY